MSSLSTGRRRPSTPAVASPGILQNSSVKTTVISLRDIISRYVSPAVWNLHVRDWLFVLKTLVCVESVLRTVPELKNYAETIEQLSSDGYDFLYI